MLLKKKAVKIALFSDIHANLPALEAFFEDVEKRDVDALFCLGDLVGYNIWPNEVIEEIRKRRIPTIAGNYDYGIGRSSNDCGCAYKTEAEKENGALSIALTNDLISEENRRYLRSLPAHLKLEFELSEGNLKVLLVHGSPRKINEYLFEDRSEKSLLRLIKDADADILCFGHTHKPYHRILFSEDESAPQPYHAINLGSIGKPKDADPRGCYVLLEVDPQVSRDDKNNIAVQFVRFEYDLERAAKAIEESELPNAYAANLRNGN